ncbi:hypothetical protein EPA93_39140 [Ktedonosporobacter rubrisoli]|uniref:DUF4870 domain-containing protein n=1 Tax=Ktedonosporobacter rubrisoli TaxID=2509675 RepID=A0A4P6K6Q7_KTERU|nr:hypothetical protein EPA93_39140 [Ktedonosporobacter rubrisoli]
MSYLFWWVTGLIFLFVERKNRFVRFHAAQSVITLGSAFIVYVIVSLLKAIPFIGGLIFGPIQSIVLVIALLLWAFLMFRAYKGAKTRIPIAADYAEILADKFMVRRSPKTKKAK